RGGKRQRHRERSGPERLPVRPDSRPAGLSVARFVSGFHLSQHYLLNLSGPTGDQPIKETVTMRTRIPLAAAGMLACLAAQPASAQSQTAEATMYITARVVKSCAIESVSGLAFGDIEGTAQAAQNEAIPGA